MALHFYCRNRSEIIICRDDHNDTCYTPPVWESAHTGRGRLWHSLTQALAWHFLSHTVCVLYGRPFPYRRAIANNHIFKRQFIVYLYRILHLTGQIRICEVRWRSSLFCETIICPCDFFNAILGGQAWERRTKVRARSGRLGVLWEMSGQSLRRKMPRSLRPEWADSHACVYAMAHYAII